MLRCLDGKVPQIRYAGKLGCEGYIGLRTLGNKEGSPSKVCVLLGAAEGTVLGACCSWAACLS